MKFSFESSLKKSALLFTIADKLQVNQMSPVMALTLHVPNKQQSQPQSTPAQQEETPAPQPQAATSQTQQVYSQLYSFVIFFNIKMFDLKPKLSIFKYSFYVNRTYRGSLCIWIVVFPDTVYCILYW